ncbi:Rossmann-fold NAD(P)-binding domain-containing protein [Aestuariibaculum sediminum]|uniref:Nucleoside-diphosphate-sugar epimerase n=1 Tax=Aestuariibaculum sediminum TaxID=2770637 RepID=A0A8J6UFP3_9FLAO|nr:hypothetical protein [Aestuariibaculum sediminum]MBD0831526.1 hypothetical protein [Aestuariibaculum sediminum]
MTLKTSKPKKLKIGILGCGWLGIRMVKIWKSDNFIYTTTTTKEKISKLEEETVHPVLVDFKNGDRKDNCDDWQAMKLLDVVVITVPINSRKDRNIDSIENKLKNLFAFLGDFKGQVFYLSSTSVYPNQPKEFIEEEMPIDKVFVENELRQRYPQINILRLGGLMGDDRQLSKYNVSNLEAPVNHIHFSDVIGVIEKMMAVKSSSKLFNVVAPLHPTKREVISIQKGQIFNAQDFDGISAKMVSSKKIERDLNYKFIYPNPSSFHLI